MKFGLFTGNFIAAVYVLSSAAYVFSSATTYAGVVLPNCPVATKQVCTFNSDMTKDCFCVVKSGDNDTNGKLVIGDTPGRPGGKDTEGKSEGNKPKGSGGNPDGGNGGNDNSGKGNPGNNKNVGNAGEHPGGHDMGGGTRGNSDGPKGSNGNSGNHGHK